MKRLGRLRGPRWLASLQQSVGRPGRRQAGSRVSVIASTWNIGGAEMQRVALCRAIAELGIPVRAEGLKAGGPTVAMLGPRVAFVLRRHPVAGVLTDAWTDRVLTGTGKPDMVRAWALRLLRPSRVWAVALHEAPAPAGTYDRVQRFLAARADQRIALSADQARLVAGEITCTAIVANATEITRVEIARTLPKAGIPLRLIVLGRLATLKGIDHLLELLAEPELRQESWVLGIAGDGSDRQRLEGLARGLGSRVQFLGFVDPVAALDDSDVMLLPSRREAQPMVILEAMARGVPVIASRTGAVGELLQNGRLGVVVEPTTAAWRTALADLFARRLALDEMADRALVEVRQRTTELMATGYLAALGVDIERSECQSVGE